VQIGIHQHRFGVNYTPTRSWWYCWNDFDENEIARDLDSIVEIGADHIRVLLIWPYFQPNPQVVSQIHLDRLHVLMTLAGERNLDVCVTLFVGWLSGYRFRPPYQNDDTFYRLDESGSYQELYLTRVADTVRDYDNFLGFDLGNELNVCWQTDSSETGDEWSRHMLALAEKHIPNGVHVNGVDHDPWFRPHTFSPSYLAQASPIITLHTWTKFTGVLERSGGDCFHPRCIRLLETMAALARSYASDPTKPVWVQEFGMTDHWTDTANIPRFLHEIVSNAIDVGVNWFTWWSSHDLDRDYSFSELEYSLGLITHDRRIKAQGQVFKELAEEYRSKNVAISRLDIPNPPETFTSESTLDWLDELLEK
jgi:endo-1,4-beta-mannosidase